MRRYRFCLRLSFLVLVVPSIVAASEAQAAKFKILHSFAGGDDGEYPNVPLTVDSAGDVYGTTGQGGSGAGCSSGCGVLFELLPTGNQWKEKILYDFSGAVNPVGQLVVSGGKFTAPPRMAATPATAARFTK